MYVMLIQTCVNGMFLKERVEITIYSFPKYADVIQTFMLMWVMKQFIE